MKLKLPLACADFTFPLLPHAQVLDLLAMLEFDGVDMGCLRGVRISGLPKFWRHPAVLERSCGASYPTVACVVPMFFCRWPPVLSPTRLIIFKRLVVGAPGIGF